MSWKEDAKEAGINILKVATGTMVEGFSQPDPALKTTSTAEAAIRNNLAFSDLVFQFPTNLRGFSGNINSDRLRFPAYITAFSDNYTPQWTATQTFGRADPIPTYSNTTRDISISVLIPCFDEEDSNENLKKINTLIKNLYPGYEDLDTGARVLNSPPLVRIKFANLLVNHTNPHKGLLGYIKSFSTELGIQEGVFTSVGKLLPRSVGFTISFSPLHETTVGWDSRKQFYGSSNFPYKPHGDASEDLASLGSKFGLGKWLGEKVNTEAILSDMGPDKKGK